MIKLALFTIPLNLKLPLPYRKPASEEEDDGKSVCPSDSNFPPIDNSDYVKQLRVLTVLNENFEVNLIPLYDEFMLSKNKTKIKYFQDNFAQSEKNRVKRKWLEKMNQLKKHILFFDFFKNHYVSNDEVSQQHLNVIKKSNFVKAADETIVKSSHPPLETILITCQDQKTEVKAIPFKIADDQTPITSIIEQNNLLRKGCHKPYWKEKFIDGLPPIFAHKVKQVLISKNDSINHDKLSYSDIFSGIKKFGINMY